MNKVWATKKGFTIIELLVSIVVIGILATIMVISYSSIQKQSRDSTRGSDIVQLKMAIEKYHSEKSLYPIVCSADNTDCPVSALATELLPYLSNIPKDPTYPLNSTSDYRYIRGATTTDSYALKITYEAKSSCKTGQNVSASWFGTSIPTC